MRAGSVHVMMRHAIVEMQCVNVVIGVHIVVLVVLLVVLLVVRRSNFPCCDTVVFAEFSWLYSCCVSTPRRLQ